MVTDKGGDAKAFMIEGKLQPEGDNENVAKLRKQMQFGIKYGFSIYGRVTKMSREVIKGSNGQERVVLEDGKLSHILITDQPANSHTFAEAIFKSMEGAGGKKPERVVNDFKHSSRIAKDEPENISIDGIPDQCYPINYTSKEVFKDYPHHYVQDGTLWLHKGLLMKSYLKAAKDGASEVVKNHLLSHVHNAGLYRKIEEMQGMVNTIDEIDCVKEKVDNLKKELGDMFSSLSAVNKFDIEVGSKKNVTRTILKQVAPKITKILNDMLEEENA
jgi:hypothetical protein